LALSSEEQRSRLALAEGLRRLADHSSESELGDSLSRSYYSLFHAILVLLGQPRIRHEDLPKRLEPVDAQLAGTVREPSKLRERADYVPDLLAREYKGSLELFRVTTAEALERGRTCYRRLLDEIGKKVS
jgi:hypothetical protein